ncbi:MAG: hypothetical protein AB8F94_18645 [Saprospiraceae bacterium]
MNNPTHPNLRQRTYLPNEFKITVWSKMRPYFHELLRRDIKSYKDLEKWILDQHELTHVIQEEFDYRKNNHFIYQTEDQRVAELYEYAVQELFPKITPFEKQLDEKLSMCKFASNISDDINLTYLRSIK